jgi:deazaflavin-dependent oxidoreductase (nitroreductase family)
MSVLVRAGVIPRSSLLITRGRRTGLVRSNPVVVVEYDGRRWLVAPYGAVGWVHNARAAGRVGLARGLRRGEYAVREVDAVEAGPVLQRYINKAVATRQYFEADRHAAVERFVAEAAHHPVFELIPIANGSSASR